MLTMLFEALSKLEFVDRNLKISAERAPQSETTRPYITIRRSVNTGTWRGFAHLESIDLRREQKPRLLSLL